MTFIIPAENVSALSVVIRIGPKKYSKKTLSGGTNRELLPMMDDFPLETLKFIDALDENHPVRCIQAGEDVILAHRYAAIREFIDQLVSLKVEYEGGIDD